ncbi:MAG: transcriptional regulator [Porticoccus sp.]|nr:transcriptional regulator [Porticoccus sp.]
MLGIAGLATRKIESRDPTVSIAHYMAVLAYGLVDDMKKVALDDELDHKLRDIKLMGSNISAQ